MLNWLLAQWEWGVALTLLGAGLTVCRSFLTRPKLIAWFDSCDLPSRKVLGYEICNLPLKWLKRETASVTGRLTIEDQAACRVVHASAIEFEGENALSGPVRRAEIPPSDDGVSIGIVDVFDKGSVHVHWNQKRLASAKYEIVIQLAENGRTWRFSKLLFVTQHAPYAEWID